MHFEDSVTEKALKDPQAFSHKTSATGSNDSYQDPDY